MGQTELQQSGSTGTQPSGVSLPLLSGRAEPLSPTPHTGSPCSRLSTASCGQAVGICTAGPCQHLLAGQETSCQHMAPFCLASQPLWQMCGTGVALMGVGADNGRSGLTSLTASPAPSSCPCILGEHHRLSCSALRNTLS